MTHYDAIATAVTWFTGLISGESPVLHEPRVKKQLLLLALLLPLLHVVAVRKLGFVARVTSMFGDVTRAAACWQTWCCGLVITQVVTHGAHIASTQRYPHAAWVRQTTVGARLWLRVFQTYNDSSSEYSTACQMPAFHCFYRHVGSWRTWIYTNKFSGFMT